MVPLRVLQVRQSKPVDLVAESENTATLFQVNVPGVLVELTINAALSITSGQEANQGQFVTMISGLLDGGFQMYAGQPNFSLSSQGVTTIAVSPTEEVLLGTGYYANFLPSSGLALHFRDRYIQYAISLNYINSTNVTTSEHMTDNTPYEWQNSLIIRDTLVDPSIYVSAYVSARLRYWVDVGSPVAAAEEAAASG